MRNTKPDSFALVTDYLRQLVDVPKEVTGTTQASGPFSFMVVFFLWKQTDHADAILRLGTHRDIELIARSMIEGVGSHHLWTFS